MSSTVNMDMVLISVANLLPQQQMSRVFLDCIKELNGHIENNSLILDNKSIGTIKIGQRIILSFDSDYNDRNYIRNKLRDTFTRRIETEYKNYLYELTKEKERLEEENNVENKILKELEEVSKQIEKSAVAFQRQHQSECEALKGEIIDAAISQGYEVVEEQNNNGVQLQFVRRDYQC